jgi:hypothetical protein
MASEDSQYMDRACQVFIVIGAIVLFIMLIGENWRKPNVYGFPKTSNTCGAMRTTTTDEKAATAASAKRVGTAVATENGRFSSNHGAELESSYASANGEWMNLKYKGCQSPEPKQDEAELLKDFPWHAPVEVNDKFDEIAVSEEKVKASAGLRAVGLNTGMQTPSQSRILGLRANPWHELLHKESDSKRVFSKSCPWFGGTDSFHSARKEVAMCDCLKDECEEECKK